MVQSIHARPCHVSDQSLSWSVGLTRFAWVRVFVETCRRFRDERTRGANQFTRDRVMCRIKALVGQSGGPVLFGLGIFFEATLTRFRLGPTLVGKVYMTKVTYLYVRSIDLITYVYMILQLVRDVTIYFSIFSLINYYIYFDNLLVYFHKYYYIY